MLVSKNFFFSIWWLILQEEKAKSGFSFVPTGPGKGSGSGVFFIDFSDDYKRCLKLARDKVEKEENLSKLEKEEMNWIKSLKESREKSLNEKMIQLKVSYSRTATATGIF